MKCAVTACPNNSGNDLTISFHSFPKEGNLRKLWEKFCGQKVEKNSKICSDHFLTEDYENSLKFELGFCKSRKLKQGAVPTIYPTDVKYSNSVKKIQRKERKKNINYGKTIEAYYDTKASNSKVGWINEELFDYREKTAQQNFGDYIENVAPSPSTSPTDTKGDVSEFSTTKCTQTDNDNAFARVFMQKGIQTNEANSANRINCGFVNVSKSGLDKYFNLQCFYCDAEYPITFWSEFSEHILQKHGHLEKDYEKKEHLYTINEHNICDNMNLTDSTTEEKEEEQEKDGEVEEILPINFINLDDIEDNNTNHVSIEASKETSFENSDSNDRSEQYLYVDKYAPSIEHSYSKYALQKSVHETLFDEAEPGDEICFGITPRAIILDFLNHLKGFQSLWYNRSLDCDIYDKELLSLANIMKAKWSLNLRMDNLFANWEKIKAWFYKTKAEKENNKHINQQLLFNEYYEKCAEFLLYGKASKFICDICNQVFINLIYLQIHKYRQHKIGQLPYSCSKCLKRFTNLDTLLNHVKCHKELWPKDAKAKKENELDNELPFQPTEQTFKCYECNESCACANEYKMHLDIHPKGNCPYVCEECGNRFKSDILRKKHQVKHNSNGYNCEVCSLKLANATSFKNHMDGHKGIYEYICEWCGRAFVCRKYWREHCQYEHLGYGICKICNREYKKRTILYKHLRTLHRPTFGTVEQLSKPCRKRGKRSKVNLKLRKHEYIIDPVTQTQRLKCPKCDKSFRRHRNLRLHATKIHNYDIRNRPRANTQTPQIPQKREKSQLFKHCWIRASNTEVTSEAAMTFNAIDKCSSTIFENSDKKY